MGDWYVDQDGAWAYDKNAPAPDPSVTGMFPAVVEQQQPDEPDHADLAPVEPAAFPAFDGVTSLMIRSIGAPE